MDASEVLEAAEEALDDVAVAIGHGIVAVGMLAVRLWGDDDLAATLGEPVTQGAGIVGAVGDELLGRSGDGQQVSCSVQIADVAGSEDKGERAAELIGQRVNLGGTSTARTPDRMSAGPPFAPAAERCAFTCMLSSEAITPPVTPVLPVKA